MTAKESTTHAVIWYVSGPQHVSIALPFGTFFGTLKGFAERFVKWELEKYDVCDVEYADSGDVMVTFHCDSDDASAFANAVMKTAMRHVATETMELDRRIEMDVH